MNLVFVRIAETHKGVRDAQVFIEVWRLQKSGSSTCT